MKKRGRKAQVTIFMILGIVILISAGVYFYLQRAGISEYEILQPESAPGDQYNFSNSSYLSTIVCLTWNFRFALLDQSSHFLHIHVDPQARTCGYVGFSIFD